MYQPYEGSAMMSFLSTKDRTITQTLQDFLAQVLETKAADAVLVPSHVTGDAAVKPCLICHPDQIRHTVPLGPGFFVNAGTMVSRLSWKPSGKKTAVWLRPCEIKAFVELTKLKQGDRDEVIILGMDCPMALSRKDYDTWVQSRSPAEVESGLPDPEEWIRNRYGHPGKPIDGFTPARACQVCETPYPVNADVSVQLFGADLDQGIVLQADTRKGEGFLEELHLPPGTKPEGRNALMADMQALHEKAFQALETDIQDQTGTMEKLNQFFSACINCHNCRSVCPVCYCRECVFNTDVFVHPPFQYLQWADKWGRVSMPFDTIFFHLTRMAHMGLTCVGCGQCTRACPGNIPVADLFISVARSAQAAFDYKPGADDAEPLPLSVFQETEFADIVGMGGSHDT
jgi:formate dehydrogenase (coenzyme F420) beta subunit